MTDEEKKRLHDIQNVPVDEDKFKRDRSNTLLVELSTKLDSMSKEDFKKVFDKYAIDFNEESINEDLEEAAEKCRWNIEEYCYQNDNGSYLYSEDDIEESFKAGAKWQKEQNQETIETAIHHAYHNGRLEMKEQMMENTIDAHCFGFQGAAALFSFRLPAGSYLVGSKVKVIVIKED